MKLIINYNKYLLKILPILNYYIYKNELYINVPLNKLFYIIFFFKNHSNCQFEILSDICVVDYINNIKRFEIVYNLLSIRFNNRLKIKININENELIDSISNIYRSANWLEREAWDMFGIFFKNNKDLRRILTDYGFEGYPLRKDFPLSGFLEIYYNELKKNINYVPLNLLQKYNFFKFNNTWNSNIY